MDGMPINTLRGGVFGIFYTLHVISQMVSGSMYGASSSRLRDGLLSSYYPDVIPLESEDSPVVLKIFPTIVKLDNDISSNSVMEVTLSLSMNWNDPRLRWDPEMFDNISQIYTPLKHLWRPDINVHDMGQGRNEHLFHDNDLVIVEYTGSVTYAPIVHVRFLCSTNHYEFPYDESRCYVTIGSWLYTARHIKMEFWHTNESAMRLDLQADNMASDTLPRTTRQWSLVGNKAWGYMRNMTHACCPDDPNILFEITLQLGRNSGWTAAVLLLSVIVPALLVPLQFCISPRSDTRLIHGFVGLLMSFASAAVLTALFPTTQTSISKIGISILGIITISIAALVSSIIITVFSQREKMGASPPNWLAQITLLFQPLFCVNLNTKPPSGQHQPSRIYRPPHGANGDFNRSDGIPLQEVTDVPAARPGPEKDHTSTSMHAEFESLYANMNMVVEQLSALLNVFDKKPRANGEWGGIITVLDRMCLFAFTLLSIIFILIALL